MNKFGGEWTEDKMTVFMKYVKAFLQIMKNKRFYKLLYFDGFAGSGSISQNDDFEIIQGVATQVLSIDEPREFDIYYFVEKNKKNADHLRNLISQRFPNKKAFVAQDNCNQKIIDLANFLNREENKNYRGLVFIDPYGMQLQWSAMQALKGINVDVWLLFPSGIGVGRLLRRDGKIESTWMNRLIKFTGMTEEDIMAYFYRTETTNTLFGEELTIYKEKKAVERAVELYKKRIQKESLFKYVSESLVLKNSIGFTMYDFFMCTNNPIALKIANDINKIHRK